jgi:hypothetical protein
MISIFEMFIFQSEEKETQRGRRPDPGQHGHRGLEAFLSFAQVLEQRKT